MKVKRLFDPDSGGNNSGSSKKSKSSSPFIFIGSGPNSSSSVSNASSNTKHESVQITTLRANTSSYRMLQRTQEYEVPRLLTPSISPLLESSQKYDEFGSLHTDPDSGTFDNDNSEQNYDTGRQFEGLLDPPRPSTTSPSDDIAQPSPLEDHSRFDTTKRNRMKVALERWLPNRSNFLDEILRGEGCGDGSFAECSTCHGPEALYKCNDCLGGFLYCKDCMLRAHDRLPLHRILRYNTRFFEKYSLQELGLRVQLGHENGRACPSRKPGPSNFTVVHSNGVHRVGIDFCGCGYSPGGHQSTTQLLRIQWFPASFERPSTAITFDCLDLYLDLTHSSKMNTYDFYTALAHRTDNTGRESADFRYHEFSLVSRLWRHLTMLKRAGRAHDPLGPSATKEGSLAVLCPACPQPGYNLPEDWKSNPKKFLFTLFLAIDANFKLKLKERGFTDIELAPGWAYFVEEKNFQNVIRDHPREIESNTCRSMHNALLHATNLNSKGYAASGVGAVVCGRHSFVRPNGVGDLQKGEKYVNMDYIVLCTLIGVLSTHIFLTYNIACQWSKHFVKRQSHFPEAMRLPTDINLRYGIPSFHVAGHGPKCQTSYALNLLPGVGRTYGEGIESQWAHMNAAGASTREQAPAMRHEVLGDLWGAYNWHNTLTFESHLKKSLVTAVEQYHRQKSVFEEFSSTFEAKVLEDWEQQIIKWENDPKAKNPYAEVESSITLNQVRVQLAEEEAAELQSGASPKHTMTASSFLNEGLELEEQQRTLLLRDPLRDHQINSKSADLQERRNSLWSMIEIWRRVQDIYMAYAASLRVVPEDAPATTSFEEGAVKHPETLRLCLPSSIPLDLALNDPHQLRLKETRLRRAQAEDALNEVRRYRRTLTGVSIFKKLNVTGTGQKPNTRVRDIYDRLEKLCRRAVERYRAARAALLILDPKGDWTGVLRELHDADVSGPQRDPDVDPSEGRYQVSWIWRLPGCNTTVNENSAEFSENMRVEWSRSRARYLRWKEEIELLCEEMRRVVVFMERKSSWWKEQGQLRVGSKDTRESVLNGLSMYAEKQAEYMTDIACRCAIQWHPLFVRFRIPAPWIDNFMRDHKISSKDAKGKKRAEDIDYDLTFLFA